MNTLSRRIYGIVSLLLLGLGLAVGLAAISTTRLVRATERLGSVSLVSVELIQQLSGWLDRQNSIVNGAPAELDLEKGKAQAEIFRQNEVLVAGVITQLDPLCEDPELQKALHQLQRDLPALRTGAEKVFKLAADFLQQEAVGTLQQEVNPVQERIRQAQTTLASRAIALAAAAPAAIVTEAQLGRQVVLVVGLATLLLGAAASIWVVRRFVVAPLRRLATDLAANSDQTMESAEAVASASQALAAGASEQAASVEETSATLEEISSVTKRNAENAENARELAGRARSAAEGGSTEMTEMSSAVADIKRASDNIAKIIKTIDEIAFQTNILALNAAVEAARAGEAGMGFAVVAEEVRNLAQRSATAAKETAEKIEHSLQASERGVQISSKVVTRLSEILGSAREVDALVGEIANASREQNAGIAQVGSAVSQIENVTQSNAANAEETSSAAEELNAQAVTLRESVAQLTLLIDGTRSGARREATVDGTSQPPAATRRRAPGGPAARSPQLQEAANGRGDPDFFASTTARQHPAPVDSASGLLRPRVNGSTRNGHRVGE